MLSDDAKISFDMLLAKKLSTRAEAADRLLPDLLAAEDPRLPTLIPGVLHSFRPEPVT